MTEIVSSPSAEAVRQSFVLAEGVLLLGSLENGVTVYSQQVRALNLIWSVSETTREKPLRIAIVGGGIAGLTAAAAALVTFPESHVQVFERRSDLCPLQQGSDTRWLHPRIYDWPDENSRAPSAGLPFMDWHEGRASDVVHRLLTGFSAVAQKSASRLTIFVDVAHLKVAAAKRSIQWVGHSATLLGSHCKPSEKIGTEQEFDLIVIAAGFGLERCDPNYPTPSYWRNDDIAQPVLEGHARSYIVSGFGDGGLIDVCRLTIERFRQDRIVYDLFQDLESAERTLRTWKAEHLRGRDVFTLMSSEMAALEPALAALRARVRKDTRVHLHAWSDTTSLGLFDIFNSRSSFLNKVLLFLLYRLGAFSPNFQSLECAVRSHGIAHSRVICRHGPTPISHIRELFLDPDSIQASLLAMASAPKQSPSPMWPLTFYPCIQGW